MYQYVEKKTTKTRDLPDGGKEEFTTFTYEKEWRDTWIDSDGFDDRYGHENPPFFVHSAIYEAKHVQLGDYELPEELIGKMSAYQPCTDAQVLIVGEREL